MLESPCSLNDSQVHQSAFPGPRSRSTFRARRHDRWPESRHAGVAKLAYAQDLKSCSPKGEYGFDPRLLHHSAEIKIKRFAHGTRLRAWKSLLSWGIAQRSGPDDEMIEEDRLIGGNAMVGFDVLP